MSKLGITRATTTVNLVTNLDLLAEHETALAALERAQKKQPVDRLNTPSNVRELAKAVTEIEKQMEDSIVTFKLRALTRAAWGKFVDAHPKRDDNDADDRLGVNTDTFFDAVLPESIVEVRNHDGEKVEFEPAEWAELSEEISDAQYAEFVGAVYRLNQRDSEVPFSRIASALTRDSGETSK